MYTCRCSRAPLTAGAASSTSDSNNPNRGRRNNVFLVNGSERVERIVEELRANVQPLGDQAKLGRAQVARMRAAGARCKASEERAGERTVRISFIHVGSH